MLLRVKQGYILSPSLLNILLDQVMRDSESVDNIFEFKIEFSTELRYADNTVLISVMAKSCNYPQKSLPKIGVKNKSTEK